MSNSEEIKPIAFIHNKLCLAGGTCTVSVSQHTEHKIQKNFKIP